MKRRFLLGYVILACCGAQAAWAEPPAAALPSDPRLAPIRVSLDQALAAATREDLPAALLVSKVREGLAKNVDPARITGAVTRLLQALRDARSFAQAQGRPRPSSELLTAIARARIAGIDAASLGPLCAPGREDHAARAIDALVDIAARGFPADRTGALIARIETKEPGSSPRLALILEANRREHAIGPAEAVDTLTRAYALASSLTEAVRRTNEDVSSGGQGRARGSKDDDQQPGRGLGLGRVKHPDGPPGRAGK